MTMNYVEMVRTIEQEIAQAKHRIANLTRALDALSGLSKTIQPTRKAGNVVSIRRAGNVVSVRRPLSASARKRIAIAQKARWAKWHRTRRAA